MKVGVLCHGRHLQTKNWKKLMWGTPPDFLGQLPKTVLVAIQGNAEIIVFGSGASEKDGRKEAEFIRDYLLKHFLDLDEFPAFWGIDLARTREKIAKIAVLDVCSQNTTQEIRFSGKIFEEVDVERVIAVTSPTHAPRCLNEALKFYGRPGSKISVGNILVLSSDIGWAPNDDVVVIEPSHLPDDRTGELRIKIAPLLLQPAKLAEIAKALGL